MESLTVASLKIGNTDTDKVIIEITAVEAVEIEGKITPMVMTDNIITIKVRGLTRMANEKGHILRTLERVLVIRKGLNNREINTTTENSTN